MKSFGTGCALAVTVVIALTIVFRVPSCAESFWIDELHSAWAVSDGFADVAQRAAIGNQTTGYFHLLWVWSALLGQGEVAMRLSSVLISALTAGVLVVAVARQTGRVAGGWIAGGIFAVDPNAIFFGCELRPYALVMLCAVLATWSLSIWIGTPCGQGLSSGGLWHSFAGARWRLAMLFWICVAALVHPTSLGVLWLWVPLGLVIAWKRNRLTLWRADAVAAVLVAATLVSLALSSLPSSWAHRDQWRAFGQATTWWQLWYAWDWVPIVLMPLAAALLLGLLGWIVGRQGRNAAAAEPIDRAIQADVVVWAAPAIVALLGTLVFFVASYFQWVPLWHRRYYVAALPLLAWSSGALVAGGINSLQRGWAGRIWNAWGPSLVGGLVAIALIGFQLWYQGTLATLSAGQMPLHLRGERWREAVQLVRAERNPADPVWLDSGLIEADFFHRPVGETDPIQPEQWDYLAFPLRGPYPLDNVLVVSSGEADSWMQQHLATLPPSATTVWLVTRSGQQSVQRYLSRLDQQRPVQASVRQAGRIAVLKLQFRD
ncbi:glycosyltransferase family 39 protein [Stieleria sp. TO1_6]|uniref:glycosyltransferase family 39 protein n=1 Tax=Stieleria tagensis TaxID=2956795 RepID=UPI00209B21BD|nr:glycosyltransferase family 39 protein [Stieleria tagensis]MCO8125413.1 glycosyltransferase family 39 protein [Stieleria tagensis]